jgi:hypothetical protein
MCGRLIQSEPLKLAIVDGLNVRDGRADEPSALVHPAALPTPSCESFVASQKGEDWLFVPDRYDDDGFLCANLQRPARRLLAASKGVGLTWWLSTRSTGYPARWWTSIN